MSRSRLLVLPVLGALAFGTGCQRAVPSAHASPTAAAATAATSAAPDVAALVAKVKGAVVNITVEHQSKAPAAFDEDGEGSPFDFFFRRGPGMPGPQQRKQRALGSGFIVDAKGHVVTNAHVVEDADVVRVKLADEREFKAKVLGRDRRLDLAVLEIEGASSLPAVPLGDSEGLRVGEYVVAIGNPFGLGHTVTMGIVSAKGRAIGAGPYYDFIQTYASINQGNSGGPLFDMRGNVVGINTAINPAGQGIGFAIPAAALQEVLPQLLADGHVKRGRLGVHIQSLDETMAKAMGLSGTRGALVGDLEKGGPAEKAGIQPGDVIVSVDGTPVSRSQDLPRMVARHAPGSRAKVTVLRSGAEKTFDVTLDELKDESGKRQGSPSAPQKGALGLEVQDAEDGGVLVRRVMPGSPAGGKLMSGDVILEVDRAPVKSSADLSAAVRKAGADKPILLLVKRQGSTRYVAIERK